MDINIEKGTIIIFGKSSKLETMVQKFASLSGEQVYSFFTNRGIQLPRRINVLAMYSVLNDRIKWVNSNTLTKDYFTRLKYYSHFTESQLYNLFLSIANDNESFELYRKNLFRLILINFVALDLKDGELNYVKTLKKSRTEPFEQYFNFISGACLEQDETFDGVNTFDLRDYLALSASNQEIVDIATKYGIELPLRLSKEQFLAYIYDKMQKNNTYSEEIKEELDKMSIQQLNTYAKRTGINMDVQMTKEQLVIYLFWYLEQCQISKTTVRRIEILDEYYPLEFEVDTEKINIFGNGRGKRIIKYDGMFEDTSKWEAIQNGTYNKPKEEPVKVEDEEEVEQTPVFEVKPEPEKEEKKTEEVQNTTTVYEKEEATPAPYEINSGLDATTIHGDTNTLDKITEEVKENKFDNSNAVEKKIEKPQEAAPKIDAVERATKERTDIVPNIKNEIKEEKEIVSPEKTHGLLVDEDFASTGVYENEKYGSDSILGIDKNESAKITILVILILLLLGGIGFLIYYFILR